MSARSALLRLLIAGAVAILATSGPAAAQCRLCDTPTTARDEVAGGRDIQLEIETSLNFDRLILYGSGTGTALIRPDGSTDHSPSRTAHSASLAPLVRSLFACAGTG